MSGMNRREFIEKLSIGVFGSIIYSRLVPALVSHSDAHVQHPWQLGPVIGMRTVVVGVGPAGARMAKMLSCHRPDIQCHGIELSSAAGPKDHLPSLLEAIYESYLLFVLFSSEDSIHFPLIRAIALTGLENGILTIGVSDGHQGAEGILQLQADNLEAAFNSRIRVSAA